MWSIAKLWITSFAIKKHSEIIIAREKFISLTSKTKMYFKKKKTGCYFHKDLTQGEYYQYMRELKIARIKVFIGGIVLGGLVVGLVVYNITATYCLNIIQ